MEKGRLKARIGETADQGPSKAVSREGWTSGPAFRPPLLRQIQQDRCTMNELRIYTANKQEIIDGFKYLHGICRLPGEHMTRERRAEAGDRRT